jgi:putative hemolysin
MQVLLNLLILGLLLFLSAFFAAAETAIFSLSKMEKRRLQEKHPRLGKMVLYHLEHPKRTLVTILIGNLVVNTLAASVFTLIVLEFLHPKYLSFLLALFTFVLIVAAEIMPKTFAVHQNEFTALVTSVPLQGFALLLAPFRMLVIRINNAALSFLIPDHKEHSDLKMSEEELKTLVKIGEEEGVLDRQERKMLQKLLELGERPVKEIMTPRTNIAALDLEEPREKHIEMIQKYHFTHFPVYQNTVDNLLGVLAVQEYMLNPATPVQELIKQPLFIPEQKPIDDLLSDFRTKNHNFAVCVDEYGGTAGIVTLEDIFEEIFGEYYDEYTKVEHPIRALAQHEFLVEAKITLAQFNEHFSTHLEAEDATTLAGFILEKMGEVPEKGKVLQTPECEIRIQDVIRHRLIKSVIVKPAAVPR